MSGPLMPGPPEPPGFDEWAIVEVMGHRRFAGRVTEQVIAGAGFIRIDVPEVNERQPFAKLFGPTSIYGITPVDEPTARAAATAFAERPFDVWSLQQALPSPHDDDEEPPW